MTLLEKLDAWRSHLPARFEMIGMKDSEIDALIAVVKAAQANRRLYYQSVVLDEALDRLNATLPGGE